MQAATRERVRTILETAGSSGPGLRPADELLPILYDELRAMARNQLAREKPGATLQATALVHEAWMRLVGDEDPGWSGRAHFFGAAARAMRRILVERARERSREKRGGAMWRVSLDVDAAVSDEPGDDVIVLDEALERLKDRDPRKAEVVLLRHFGGMDNEEIARVLGISLTTVKSDWLYARAWLHRELAERSPGAGPDRDP
jgi:RNA polymerase sigma factor (TIGR02999 family)